MIQDIPNFLPLNENLLTGGMPTAEQMKLAAEAGVRVVINLAPFDPEQDPAGEDELAESLGMKYIHIPVDWEAPTKQNLEEFFKALDENQNSKLFVHCRANYRATAFIALYRVNRLGWKTEDALKELRKIWHPKEYPVWEKFITENLPLE